MKYIIKYDCRQTRVSIIEAENKAEALEKFIDGDNIEDYEEDSYVIGEEYDWDVSTVE